MERFEDYTVDTHEITYFIETSFDKNGILQKKVITDLTKETTTIFEIVYIRQQ